MTLGTIEIGANEFSVIKSADRLRKIDHKISVGKAKTSKQFENNGYESNYINEDLEEKIRESVLVPLEQYLAQFSEVR